MTTRAKNHYEILGINPSVSTSEIKLAYRKLVKKYHPDLAFKSKSKSQQDDAHARMKSINEAYETLMDYAKRAAYDFRIGARGRRGTSHQMPVMESEAEREAYLKRIFHPSRRSITKVLNNYKSKLTDLSLDIYDDDLLEQFSHYVDQIEEALRKASYTFSESPPPPSLAESVQWMRYSIAQAADGLEELQEFLENYNYSHLCMADNLFKIAIEHTRRANFLTRG